jgi:hypothetical protein
MGTSAIWSGSGMAELPEIKGKYWQKSALTLAADMA